jgi:opacity protein-like surface antigen
MKNPLLVCLLSVLSFTLNSQEKEKLSDIPKGYQFVKASINFSNASSGDYSAAQFSILPVYGIFIAKNISVAFGVGYSSNTVKTNNTTTMDVSGFNLIGLSRQYKHITKPFYLFLQEDIYYGSNKDGILDISSKGFGIGISPGLNYFLTNNLSIDVTLGRLGYDTSKKEGGKSLDTFGLKFDMFNVGFGFLYSW